MTHGRRTHGAVLGIELNRSSSVRSVCRQIPYSRLFPKNIAGRLKSPREECARYVAKREEIAERYAEWEITRPPEIRDASYFSPWRRRRPIPRLRYPVIEAADGGQAVGALAAHLPRPVTRRPKLNRVSPPSKDDTGEATTFNAGADRWIDLARTSRNW